MDEPSDAHEPPAAPPAGVVRRAGHGVRRVAIGAASGTKAFWLGARCIVIGAVRMVRTPWLWPYALAPVAVAIAAFVASFYWLVDWLVPAAREAAEGRLGEAGGIVAWIVTTMLLLAAGFIAFYVAFPAIVRVFAAPFLALLSDRIFKEVSGHDAPTSPGSRVVRWVLRPIGESLVLVGIRLLATVLALPLLCIPVAGPILFFAVLLPIEGMDLLDLALSARAVPLRQRLAFVRGHMAASSGLGLGALGLLAVPVLNVLFLPALVVGAALVDHAVSPDYPGPPETSPEASDPSPGADGATA